ncbi:hypothetical protein [Labedaea rhizosphaerae]|uniref:Uncharacterized protein n=1 Tax=Labedaea rhizosphaerae TaxID=598644 RepID=A0A4R6SEH5_LABRH|nr:hypothetical protein [Labedaea rhizosphaerae]TDP97446.1 hypothetical protein EV186_103410 [Labedaea rhizosphaerae]
MRVRSGVALATVVAVAGLATACGDDTTGTPVGQKTSAPATSQGPFNGKTLQLGEVVQVESADGARMQPVANGLIRSYATSVKIVEVGTADQVNDTAGGESYRAAAGGTLLAFTVSVAQDEGAEGVGDKVVADVNVDGTQRTLPEFFGSDSSSSSSEGGAQLHYVVATAQNRRAVDLELKASNVVQSFDLLQATPKGDRPAALYRSSSGTTVRQEAISPVSYKVHAFDTGEDQVNELTVENLDLGYFTGKDAAVPSDPANGWLTLSINEDSASGSYTPCVTPLTGYSLKDAAGKVYKPSEAASSVQSEPNALGDTQAVVAFEVPADFAQGTLTIAPKTAICEVSTATYKPKPVRSKATITISLPAN